MNTSVTISNVRSANEELLRMAAASAAASLSE